MLQCSIFSYRQVSLEVRIASLRASAYPVAAGETRSDPMPKESAGQKRKIEKVMHEYKEGDLKSGSGAKVKSHDQAVAIAMHEAHVPKKR